MTQVIETFPDSHHDHYSLVTFGFWLYLLTDFIFVATIFASYIVLSNNTFGGLTPKDIISLKSATLQTFVLLIASCTSGIAGAYLHRRRRVATIVFFLLTFLIGIAFLALSFHDFAKVLSTGYTWKSSAFLSMFFSLIGTIDLHVIFALIFSIVLLVPLFVHQIDSVNIRRLTCLRMFWQFIGVLWSLIYTFVYALGVI